MAAEDPNKIILTIHGMMEYGNLGGFGSPIRVRTVYLNEVLLKPSETALTISPDGYNWGYGGSGPRALAYDIVARAIPNELGQNADIVFYSKQIVDKILIPHSKMDEEFKFQCSRQWLYDNIWNKPVPRKPGITHEELSLGVEI